MTASPTNTSAPTPPAQQGETIKETLISIVIAFTMAFVFRGFVIEAFVIPTGSMAPTLMGAHMHFQGAETGYSWRVSARDARANDHTDYTNPQINIAVTDPISGEYRQFKKVPLYTGDRILVLKYLYSFFNPERFDVVVFKNPTDPSINYIKRLIGLPGEQVALVDGDVFVRPMKDGEIPAPDPAEAWSMPGWTIARKPDVQQRAVWQLVHDSSLAPLGNTSVDTGPWTPSNPKAWTMKPREYRLTSAEKNDLVFDQTRPRGTSSSAPGAQRLTWAIDDYYPYDENTTIGSNQTGQRVDRFPVTDIRSRMCVNAETSGLNAAMTLRVLAQEFNVALKGTSVTITRRSPAGGPGILGAPETVGIGTFKGFTPGTPLNIEVWHVDQSIRVYVEGERVAEANYELSPAERLRLATGKTVADMLTLQGGSAPSPLANPALYTPGAITDLRWTFSGSPVTLTRVGLDRDLFYQPGNYFGNSGPSLATHPATVLTLNGDQFFVCGDNSPASLDGRLWDRVDPWVSKEFPANDPRHPGVYREAGVVPRELMLGRAFFVYWPSLRVESSPVPVPDFGRMRFIW
jgi:signal peptidase I